MQKWNMHFGKQSVARSRSGASNEVWRIKRVSDRKRTMTCSFRTTLQECQRRKKKHPSKDEWKLERHSRKNWWESGWTNLRQRHYNLPSWNLQKHCRSLHTQVWTQRSSWKGTCWLNQCWFKHGHAFFHKSTPVPWPVDTIQRNYFQKEG